MRWIFLLVLLIGCTTSSESFEQEQKILDEVCGLCAVRYTQSSYPRIYAPSDCKLNNGRRFVCSDLGHWTRVLTVETYREDHPDQCPIDPHNRADECLFLRKGKKAFLEKD